MIPSAIQTQGDPYMVRRGPSKDCFNPFPLTLICLVSAVLFYGAIYTIMMIGPAMHKDLSHPFLTIDHETMRYIWIVVIMTTVVFVFYPRIAVSIGCGSMVAVAFTIAVPVAYTMFWDMKLSELPHILGQDYFSSENILLIFSLCFLFFSWLLSNHWDLHKQK